MGLISRPQKIGLTYTYVDEVAAGQKFIREAELDGDLNAIIQMVNGNLGVENLANNAVETSKIKDGHVTTNKLAAGAVTTAKITDLNVTAAKIAARGALKDYNSVNVTTDLSFTTVETAIHGAFPAVNQITGGLVALIPSYAIIAGIIPNNSGTVTLRVYRGPTGGDLVTTRIWAVSGGTAGMYIPVPNMPAFDAPSAGSYVYRYTLQTSSNNITISSNSASPGVIYALVF